MDGSVTDGEAFAYEADEHAWLMQQARLLRGRRFDQLDPEHLAEFLDDMAKREVREASSRVTQLLMHLLKFTFQPDRRSRSWIKSIQTQQSRLEDLFESPSLRKAAETRFAKDYERARNLAVAETGLALAAFPVTSPWTLDAMLAWTHAQTEHLPARPRRP